MAGPAPQIATAASPFISKMLLDASENPNTKGNLGHICENFGNNKSNVIHSTINFCLISNPCHKKILKSDIYLCLPPSLENNICRAVFCTRDKIF